MLQQLYFLARLTYINKFEPKINSTIDNLKYTTQIVTAILTGDNTKRLILQFKRQHSDKTKYQQRWIETLLNNTVQHIKEHGTIHPLTIEQTLILTNKIIENLIPLNNTVAIQAINPNILTKQLYQLQYKSSDTNQISLILDNIDQNDIIDQYTPPVTLGDITNDQMNEHSLDIISAIANELSYAIINYTLNEIIALANQNTTEDLNVKDFDDWADKAKHVTYYINKLSTDIARTTRRGAGNFIITTPAALAILQSHQSIFKPTNKKITNTHDLFEAGTINNITILCSTILDQNNQFDDNSFPIIIGYKNNKQSFEYDVDSGLILIAENLFNITTNNTINSKIKYYKSLTNELSDSHHYYRFGKVYF